MCLNRHFRTFVFKKHRHSEWLPFGMACNSDRPSGWGDRGASDDELSLTQSNSCGPCSLGLVLCQSYCRDSVCLYFLSVFDTYWHFQFQSSFRFWISFSKVDGSIVHFKFKGRGNSHFVVQRSCCF